MATAYTSILKLALPVQGELSGTWGDVVNDNITSMVEEAIAGLAVINTWTTNSHTLTSADGTTSESRCAMLEFTDTGTALTGDATVVCPSQSKIYICKNDSGQKVTIKTSAGTGVAIADGQTMFVFCDGTNVIEAVTSMSSLKLGTAATSIEVTAILDEDDMVSDSATALATQQSIKAYVDAQIGANNELSEVLANGNTTGGTNIVFDDNDKAIFGAGNDVQVYHDATNSYVQNYTGNLYIQNYSDDKQIQIATDNGSGGLASYFLANGNDGSVTLYNYGSAKLATTSTGVDITGTATMDGLTATTADIDGGTIDGASIGATTATTGAFTTITSSGNTTVSGSLITDTIAEETAAGGVTVDGVLLKDGGATLTSGLTGTTAVLETNDNNTQLTLKSTDADASIGPRMDLHRDSASPANNDLIGDIRYLGENDASEIIEYANIESKILDVTDGAEQGLMDLRTIVAGTSRSRVTILSDETVVNDGGQALNFRVESDGAQHMLFVDGTNNRVGIGESAPLVPLHLTTSGAGEAVRIQSDDAAGGAGPILGLYRNSSSPIDGDSLGAINFYGEDSAGNQTTYASIESEIYDVSNGTEDGRLHLKNQVNGALTSRFYMNYGETVVNESGADLDFRVETVNRSSAFFVDAGNDDIIMDATVYVDTENGGQPLTLTRSGASDQALFAWVDDSTTNFRSVQDEASGGNFRFTRTNSTRTDISYFVLNDTSGAVFNEDSTSDGDFRVESDNHSHMFFVDAGANAVSIGQGYVLDDGVYISTITGTTDAVDTKLYIRASSSGTTTTGFGPGITFAGERNGDGAVQQMARINAVAEVNSGTTLSSGLQFMTATAGVNSEKLRIANTGYVGINEQSPEGFLHITGNNSSDGATVFLQEANNNTADTLGTIFFGNNVDSSLARILSYTSGNNTTSHLRFMPTNSGTARKALDLMATEAVFNENGEDYDFRVESDGNANMLFVDAGNNRVGVGTNSPFYDFEVNGSIGADQIRIYGPTADATLGEFRYADGTYNPRLFITGNSTGIDIKNSYSSGASTVRYTNVTTEVMRHNTNYGIVFNDGGTNYMDFRVEGDTNTHMLFVDASNDVVGIKTNSPDSATPVTISGRGDKQLLLRSTGDTGYTQGSMVIASGTTDNPSNRGQGVFLFNEGNDHTYYMGSSYGNSSDQAWIVGRGTGTSYTAAAADKVNAFITAYPTSETVFNENSYDRDFRVESDSYSEALFVDAGNNVTNINGNGLNINDAHIAAKKGSIPANTNRRVRLTCNNYHGARVELVGLRTNGGDSFVYWSGRVNNNNNTGYASAFNSDTSSGTISYTFTNNGDGTFDWDFNSTGSPGYWSIYVYTSGGDGVTITETTYT
jgi:hypothetical protein